MSKRSLIVFGAGYVGEAVCREGLRRGFSVIALTRNSIKARELSELGATAIVADLSADHWHAQLAEDPDFVVNCVSSGGGGISGYRRSYIEGGASVLSWARKRNAQGTLVYTSSTSVYPQGGGVRVDESAPTEGADEKGRLLLEAEEVACAWPARRFVLRLAGIYGPGRHHLLDQLRAGSRQMDGLGDHHLNLIHRDDVAAAVWAAFQAPPEIVGGVFNVADDGAATKAEVVSWLARRLGVAEPRFTDEPSPLRRRIVPDRVIANDRIKSLLGWAPRYPSYREGYGALGGDFRGNTLSDR